MAKKSKSRRAFGSIFQRPPRPGYYVRFSWEGQRIKRTGGMSRKDAQAKLAGAEALLKAGVEIGEVLSKVFGDFHGTALSFKDAAPLYFAYAGQRKKASTLHTDVRRMRQVLTASWTAKQLARIQTPDLLNWVSVREREGAKGSTINRDLALVSAVYRWAIRSGYVEDNPVSRVERFKESRGREVYLTATECSALLDTCCASLRPLALAAIHTGMRRGELLALRWRAVDLRRQEILVEAKTEKAGRGRVVRMTDALCHELQRMKASAPRTVQQGSERVFTRLDGSAYTTAALRYQFAQALDRSHAVSVDKRRSLRFHDLRHTAASLMVGAGVPIFDVAKILGHSTLAMTMRYAHFAPEAGRAAMERLGEALNVEVAASVRTA